MRKAIISICYLLALNGWILLAQDSQNPEPDPGKGETLVSANGTWLVTYQTNPGPIPLNTPFAIEVTVTRADKKQKQDGFSLSVDGRMPHHRHGMNRTPTVKALDGGAFLVEGMLFHMPGRWELYFDIVAQGKTERAQVAVELE